MDRTQKVETDRDNDIELVHLIFAISGMITVKFMSNEHMDIILFGIKKILYKTIITMTHSAKELPKKKIYNNIASLQLVTYLLSFY